MPSCASWGIPRNPLMLFSFPPSCPSLSRHVHVPSTCPFFSLVLSLHHWIPRLVLYPPKNNSNHWKYYKFVAVWFSCIQPTSIYTFLFFKSCGWQHDYWHQDEKIIFFDIVQTKIWANEIHFDRNCWKKWCVIRYWNMKKQKKIGQCWFCKYIRKYLLWSMCTRIILQWTMWPKMHSINLKKLHDDWPNFFTNW